MTNAERLKKWLKSNKSSNTALALGIGVNPSQIGRYLTGAGRPKIPTAKRIEEVTEGAVPWAGWFE